MKDPKEQLNKCCEKCKVTGNTEETRFNFKGCWKMDCHCHQKEGKTYARDYSHSHCWNQGSSPACGVDLRMHKQCCLCDAVPPTVKEKDCKCGNSMLSELCTSCKAKCHAMGYKCVYCGLGGAYDHKEDCPIIPVKGEECECGGTFIEGAGAKKCGKCRRLVLAPPQPQQEWEEEFNERFDKYMSLRDGSKFIPEIKFFLVNQISKAEARGYEKAQHIYKVKKTGKLGREDNEKAFLAGRQQEREKFKKMVESVKQKWTRPMLDTVVGEKTAELVGTMGEHICSEVIERLDSLHSKSDKEI